MPHRPVGVPREASRTHLACGELLLTQTFTGTPDPYRVFLYYRPNGATFWSRYFVDDEAPFWWGGLSPIAQGARLSLYTHTEGLFSCEGPTFTLHGKDMPVRAGYLVPDPLLDSTLRDESIVDLSVAPD
ncbi:MAG: hypothetical protein ABW061_27135 [Polyangiaceae bacterium]